jgi:hypothetical protein
MMLTYIEIMYHETEVLMFICVQLLWLEKAGMHLPSLFLLMVVLLLSLLLPLVGKKAVLLFPLAGNRTFNVCHSLKTGGKTSDLT